MEKLIEKLEIVGETGGASEKQQTKRQREATSPHKILIFVYRSFLLYIQHLVDL